jgi:intracellular septation protein A
LKQAVYYTFLNLATPIVFYLAFQLRGAKPAIAFALAVSVVQVIAHLYYRVRMTPLFIVATGFTVLFGTIDLVIHSPRFFRLEPFAQNFVVATVLWVSIFLRIPLAAWFLAGLPRKLRPDLAVLPDDYLKKLTFIWIAYLYVKSGIFLYLAYEVDLGELVILRSLIGGGTLFLMFVGEIVYRKWLRR